MGKSLLTVRVCSMGGGVAACAGMMELAQLVLATFGVIVAITDRLSSHSEVPLPVVQFDVIVLSNVGACPKGVGSFVPTDHANVVCSDNGSWTLLARLSSSLGCRRVTLAMPPILSFVVVKLTLEGDNLCITVCCPCSGC